MYYKILKKCSDIVEPSEVTVLLITYLITYHIMTTKLLTTKEYKQTLNNTSYSIEIY